MTRALVALACGATVACQAADSRPSARTETSSGAIRDSAITLTDDAGREIHLAGPARRVISLIPSATETIIALGGTSQIAGRTRYDVAPEVSSLPSVGGGIDPSTEAVVGLRPDLILAWDNDQRRLVPNRLIALGIPVFTLRTEDTTDVFRGIKNIGRLIGRDSAAGALAASIHAQLEDVRRSVEGRTRPRVLYVVFNDPPMTAGRTTFIGQLIELAGGQSIFADATQLWPTVSMEEIVRRQPDVLVVPTGEFKTNSIDRFKNRPGWRDLRAVRERRVATVSANLMSRPGPNIGRAARVLRGSFYPDLARSDDSLDVVRPASAGKR